MSAQLDLNQKQTDRFSQFKEKCRKEGAAMLLENTKKMEKKMEILMKIQYWRILTFLSLILVTSCKMKQNETQSEL